MNEVVKDKVHNLLDELEKISENQRNNDECSFHNFIWDEFRSETEYHRELRRKPIKIITDEFTLLEQWTQQKIGPILFDSDEDDWTTRNVLIERILSKEKLA